jgi:thiosulfate dehydrogenase
VSDDRRRRLIDRRPARVARWLAVLLLAATALVAFNRGPALAGLPTSAGRSVVPPHSAELGAIPTDSIDPAVVPPDSAIPHDSLGASMRRGLALLTHTHDSLPHYAPSSLRCVSCHLDGGRRVGIAPLIGSFARYPRYLDRAGDVVSIEDRVNFCLTRSLAGRPLPAASREMHDIVSYLSWLSTNVPIGAGVRGQGLPKMPALRGDSARGAALFGPTCARCHGRTGEGTPVAPALWGARSFSIGASMAREEREASFIRHAMPYDMPGSLSDQQAYDLAAFVISHARPDLPGKSHDWPGGGAPYDVPYATSGHAAYRPPPLIPRGGDSTTMIVPPAVSERRGSPSAD